MIFFLPKISFKFRPVNDNPYLHLPVEEEEEDIEMSQMYE